jgi:hypothetical protein
MLYFRTKDKIRNLASEQDVAPVSSIGHLEFSLTNWELVPKVK